MGARLKVVSGDDKSFGKRLASTGVEEAAAELLRAVDEWQRRGARKPDVMLGHALSIADRMRKGMAALRKMAGLTEGGIVPAGGILKEDEVKAFEAADAEIKSAVIQAEATQMLVASGNMTAKSASPDVLRKLIRAMQSAARTLVLNGDAFDRVLPLPPGVGIPEQVKEAMERAVRALAGAFRKLAKYMIATLGIVALIFIGLVGHEVYQRYKGRR